MGWQRYMLLLKTLKLDDPAIHGRICAKMSKLNGASREVGTRNNCSELRRSTDLTSGERGTHFVKTTIHQTHFSSAGHLHAQSHQLTIPTLRTRSANVRLNPRPHPVHIALVKRLNISQRSNLALRVLHGELRSWLCFPICVTIRLFPQPQQLHGRMIAPFALF
jgi:hypothetical protein